MYIGEEKHVLSGMILEAERSGYMVVCWKRKKLFVESYC